MLRKIFTASFVAGILLSSAQESAANPVGSYRQCVSSSVKSVTARYGWDEPRIKDSVVQSCMGPYKRLIAAIGSDAALEEMYQSFVVTRAIYERHGR